jgi:hypothetical protein
MGLLVMGSLALPTLARAADPLQQAETAYSSVDFGETERLAKMALDGGGHDRQQMIRIYFLLGVSAAAQGKDEESLSAFKHLISLDPDTKLDRGLSPKLQGPMLEAKGSPPGLLACETVFDRGKGALHITTHDPLNMGRAVIVHWRVSNTGEFTESRGPASASLDVPFNASIGAEHVEYTFQLLDEHMNRLYEKGTESAPEVFQVQATPTGGPAPNKVLPTKWLVVGIIGEIIGVAGIAGGIGAYVVGNNAADRWNNDSICLAGGMSRSQNCSGDKSTADAASSGAIAAFTIGGVFIVASTILLAAAPREVREEKPAAKRSSPLARLRCGSGPGFVGVSCGGAF